MPKPTIVICSSASFYKHVNEIKSQLEKDGLKVVVPKGARRMEKAGDYDVEKYKPWFNNEADYDQKADLMRTHFDEITKGDVILVVNDEKHGQPNYIGANVLMEMSLAWYQNKPIYLMNDVPKNSPFEEEIKGLRPIPLKGRLTSLKRS